MLLLLAFRALAAPFASPDIVLTSDLPAELFARWVAGVGDVDADGWPDLVVGAPVAQHVYVYMGSADGFPASPSATIASEQVSTNFGARVAAAGDVNGDGYDDVLISAPVRTQDVFPSVSLFLGSATGLEPTPTSTVYGDDAEGEFGTALSAAGDVDADGYDDVVIGDFKHERKGRAFLFRGSADGLVTEPTVLGTGRGDSALGAGVAGVGDVNGDGYDDVAVGLPGWHDWRGQVYLYLGSASGLTDVPDLTLSGFSANDQFGGEVEGVGDVDGDGLDDLLVGAVGYDVHQGRAYLYRGRSTGVETTPVTILTGRESRSYLAASLAGVGDLDGDGLADVVVGAPAHDSGHGYVGVYRGSSRGLDWASHASIEGTGTRDNYGLSVTGIGDLDGDGLADFAVAALGTDAREPRIEVYFGTSAWP